MLRRQASPFFNKLKLDPYVFLKPAMMLSSVDRLGLNLVKGSEERLGIVRSKEASWSAAVFSARFREP